MESNIKIYTDGSSLGNPGPGGWGVVIINNEELIIKNEVISSKQKVESSKEYVARNIEKKEDNTKNKIIKELGGGDKYTTNNKMELQAVIEALKYINKNNTIDSVDIFVDSTYVLSGITMWIHNWEKNDWRTANKKSVLNKDLWQELIKEVRNFKGELSWQKVKGHSGHIYNDKADEIATTYAFKQK